MKTKLTIRSLVPCILLGAPWSANAQLLSTANANEHWVATWGTALHPPELIPGQPGSPAFRNQTLRQIVHASIGGSRVRVRLSTIGAGGLLVGSAHIARRATGAAIDPLSDRKLTFGGQASIRIPPGAEVLSDPVELEAPPFSDLAVSIFLPEDTTPAAWHFEALQTSYVSPEGDLTPVADMPFVSTTRYRDTRGIEHDAWFWLAGVEVMASRQTGTIVTFGDSVTDGTQSTTDANRRWPDYLARQLAAQPGANKMAVVNAGIAGSKLLNDILGPNGLARFQRDVLAQPGVTHVITLLGNNDLLFVFSPAEFVTAEEIIQGHKQLIERARARGLTIYGGTLTPFGGFFFSSTAKEGARQKVNDWIRTSGEYDAVIDFDEVLRDPANPTQLRGEYDSGDHLHPNDDGYRKMAEAIDPRLFQHNESKRYQQEARRN